MYDNQEELKAMADAAKRQLEAQQNGDTDNRQDISYDGIFDDEQQEQDTPQIISQNNIQDDEEYLMNKISSNPPTLNPYDNVLFPGGPTESQIQSWKKEWDGYELFVTEILNETFIFRNINRFEYKQIVTLTNIDALQREEIICRTATLWPINYSSIEMATTKAGIPSTYSEIIMEKSGFTKDFAIQEI